MTGWLDFLAGLPSGLYDVNNDGQTASSYSCARCHTTRYGSVGATEPAASSPTIKSGITGTWWYNGIQCERCHKDDTNDYGGHNCYINGILDPTKTSYAAWKKPEGTLMLSVVFL